MTRKIFGSVLRVVPLVILLCLLLAGCKHKHDWQAADCDTPKTCSDCQATEGKAQGHTWADATCAAPKTCSDCGLTEGESLAHTWVDATCAAPKHCSLCNATEGEALAHTWADATCAAPKTCSVCNATEGEALAHAWVDATCTKAKTCSVCKATEGEALAHAWVDATCTKAKFCTRCQRKEGSALPHTWLDATTENPRICTQCGKTEGTRIITDTRFQTAFCKDLFGTWSGVVQMPGSEIIGEGFVGALELDYTISFKNNGGYKETAKIKNKEQFAKNVETYYIDALYKEFAAEGYNQAQADEAMKATYGMDVKAYANKMANSINYDTLFSADVSGVYYVTNKGALYTAASWNSQMQPDGFKISGNTLTIDSLSEEFPGLVLTKS